MWVELALGFLAAVVASDENDVQRKESNNQVEIRRIERTEATENYQRQLEIARIQKENDDAARKHETTQNIINGVFTLLNAVAANRESFQEKPLQQSQTLRITGDSVDRSDE